MADCTTVAKLRQFLKDNEICLIADCDDKYTWVSIVLQYCPTCGDDVTHDLGSCIQFPTEAATNG